MPYLFDTIFKKKLHGEWESPWEVSRLLFIFSQTPYRQLEHRLLCAMPVVSAAIQNVVLSLAAGISMLIIQFYLLTVQGEKSY